MNRTFCPTEVENSGYRGQSILYHSEWPGATRGRECYSLEHSFKFMAGGAPQRLWCLKEAAGFLGVSERTAIKMAKRGELPAFRVGPKLWRIRQEDVFALVRARAVCAEGVT